MSYNERTQLSNPVLATQKAKHVKAVKNDQVLCLTPRHVASHVIGKLGNTGHISTAHSIMIIANSDLTQLCVYPLGVNS